MATPAQIAANRLNAQKSSGPKSLGGQVRSSFNGLRHGLYARDVVLPGEDRAAYEDLLENLGRDLKPEGLMEEQLVQSICDLWWRLGRTAAIEAGLLNPDWSEDPRAGRRVSGGGPLVDAFRVAIDDTKTLDLLGRYEARLQRALTRNLASLERLQAARRRSRKSSHPRPPEFENPAIEK